MIYRLCFLLKLKYTISPSNLTNIHESHGDGSRSIQIPLDNSYLVNLYWMPSGYQKASLQRILILFNQNIFIDTENFEHIKYIRVVEPIKWCNIIIYSTPQLANCTQSFFLFLSRHMLNKIDTIWKNDCIQMGCQNTIYIYIYIHTHTKSCQNDDDVTLLHWFTDANQLDPNYKEVYCNFLKVRNVRCCK